MRVFITGLTGFIGAELARHLQACGHEIFGSSTRESAAAGARVIRHRLGEPIDARWLDGVDVLVHAAWDLSPRAGARNLEGTGEWREAAAKQGAHAVFISSYSAHLDFPTAYGRDKAAAEREFMGPAASIVRPALVIGNGGLFADLMLAVQRGVLLPLPDGGRPELDLIDVMDLCDATRRIAEQRRAGSANLSAGRRSLRDVCSSVARGLGRRPPLVVPVPTRPVVLMLGALAAASRGAVDLQLRERLMGYAENARRGRRSDLAEIIGRAPEDPIKSVLAHARRAAANH